MENKATLTSLAEELEAIIKKYGYRTLVSFTMLGDKDNGGCKITYEK